MASYWICKVGDGKTVRVESLPAGELEEIAKAAGMTWLEVQFQPLKTAQSATAIYERCCREAAVEPRRSLSGAELIEAFELTDRDDLPPVFADGVPEGKAATSTGG